MGGGPSIDVRGMVQVFLALGAVGLVVAFSAGLLIGWAVWS